MSLLQGNITHTRLYFCLSKFQMGLDCSLWKPAVVEIIRMINCVCLCGNFAAQNSVMCVSPLCLCLLLRAKTRKRVPNQLWCTSRSWRQITVTISYWAVSSRCECHSTTTLSGNKYTHPRTGTHGRSHSNEYFFSDHFNPQFSHTVSVPTARGLQQIAQ